MILVGHITSTHGIKGELKCYSNFSLEHEVFKTNQTIIINNQEHTITSSRFHKNHYLITIDNLEDINLVEEYRNQDVYIKRESLHLPENKYLIEDLVGMGVYEDENYLGEITNIVYNKGGKLLSVLGTHTFYIPLQDYFIKKVDLEKRRVEVENTKGLWS